LRDILFLGLGVFLLLVSGSAWGEDVSPSETLPDITVVDTAKVTTPGQSVLSQQTLQALPQGDGAITDLLKVLPGIQFSETSNSSLTGGEILPAEISISGGRVYDNSFLIDGISNNSLIDPSSDNPMSITDVPGHSQEIFLDSSLIESVTVQRSNISARYSGFTGGLVEMETKSPGQIFSGEIGLRSTRSEWTSFYVSDDDKEDFESTEDFNKQSEFRKYNEHVNLDIPLTETQGVLFSYSNSYAEIPVSILGQEEEQCRISENFFLKYQFKPDSKTKLSITGVYNPYEAEYFVLNTKDSDFTIEGGGFSLNVDFTREFSFGKVELLSSWRESDNNRDAPDAFYSWDSSVESTSWGEEYASFSQEGGYGDVEKSQESKMLAFHFESVPLETFGGVKHTFFAGASYERSVADYKRDEDVVLSRWAASDEVVCSDDDPYCIEGEQLAYTLTVYNAEQTDAEITFTDVYFEDVIELGNFTYRPGVHFGRNDLMKNNDYAFRNALFYDFFKDGGTILSAGLNRYYGKTFLTYALLEGRTASELWKRSRYKTKVDGVTVYEIRLQDDGTPEPWTITNLSYRPGVLSHLKTPYVDEWIVGFEQDLFGGRLTLDYLERDGEDALVYSDEEDLDGNNIRVLTNDGDSSYEEVSLSWQRSWNNRQVLLINGTWQRSFSTNESYDDLDIEDIEEIVFYNGQQKFLSNLPRNDYNREWSANIIYSIKLDHGFTFTNITRYRSGYEGIADSGENHVLDDGSKIDIYIDRHYPSATTFDWKLEWTYVFTDTQALTATFDIYNVFNRKVYTGSEGEYELGRQLWVGMTYDF
jgi:hypothetical protein